MADLILSGDLNLMGDLNLKGDQGGKVKVNQAEVLVESTTPPQGIAHCEKAPPVLLPPPPVGPIDPGIKVWVINSFNKTVKAGGKRIVTQGIVMQGNKPTWPGMVLPSEGNTTVKINQILINVVEKDKAVIFPSGGIAQLTVSGQG